MHISLARVVQRLDNAIHRINRYPVDSVVCFVNTYPLDSDYPVDNVIQPLNNRGLIYGFKIGDENLYTVGSPIF